MIRKYGIIGLLGCCLTFSQSATALNIIIEAPGGYSADALAAFDRAAAQWEDRISDPITVTINTSFRTFTNPNTIGSASTVLLTPIVEPYGTIRDWMVADAANEPDDSIVSYLPATLSALNVTVPDGFTVTGIAASKANLKALEVVGLDLDAIFGASDGTIDFNTGFSFDYDNSDGVTPGQMDFETVAAHEIGHILGFTSVVDDIAYMIENGLTDDDVRMTPLDLFRFENDSANDPSTPQEFTDSARSLMPGGDPIFDDIMNEILMSDGVSRQASHWEDGLGIGIMDPTLYLGEISLVSELDLRALDLIGYEITTIPLPAGFWLFGSGLIGLAYLRRTKPKYRT